MVWATSTGIYQVLGVGPTDKLDGVNREGGGGDGDLQDTVEEGIRALAAWLYFTVPHLS